MIIILQILLYSISSQRSTCEDDSIVGHFWGNKVLTLQFVGTTTVVTVVSSWRCHFLFWIEQRMIEHWITNKTMRVSCPKSFSLSIHFTEVELPRRAVLNAECVEYFPLNAFSRAREGLAEGSENKQERQLALQVWPAQPLVYFHKRRGDQIESLSTCSQFPKNDEAASLKELQTWICAHFRL